MVYKQNDDVDDGKNMKEDFQIKMRWRYGDEDDEEKDETEEIQFDKSIKKKKKKSFIIKIYYHLIVYETKDSRCK